MTPAESLNLAHLVSHSSAFEDGAKENKKGRIGDTRHIGEIHSPAMDYGAL